MARTYIVDAAWTACARPRRASGAIATISIAVRL
ncbi:hypothetical protein FHS93_002500 [Sphingobium francense]|nr:hypothetical protein [Sphingobium indicum]